MLVVRVGTYPVCWNTEFSKGWVAAEAREKKVYGFKPCMWDKPQRNLSLRIICHKPQDLSKHCLLEKNEVSLSKYILYCLIITFLFNVPFIYVSQFWTRPKWRVWTIWSHKHHLMFEYMSFRVAHLLEKQDGSHEPDCIHVLGLRVKTSAIGKQAFFSCIVRAYRLSEGTWSTVHKRQLMHKDTHRKHRLKTVHISPVTSLQCGVESVECGVESVEWVWSAECEV